MKHILCFGDSNLFGTNPSGGRWPLEQRWTGLLANALGSEYRIIEEGLGGRTTVFDDPLEENRNGSLQLPLMLQSHRPLDMVILSLGTNDCKTFFNANAKIIAKALEKLSLLVKSHPYGEHYPIPQVLVISPIHMGETIEDSPFSSFDHSSYLVSKSLAPAIKAMAEKNSLLFLDASLVAQSSLIDRLHMDTGGHAALAKAILPLLLDWFEDERSVVGENVMSRISDNENAQIVQGESDKLIHECQDGQTKQETQEKQSELGNKKEAATAPRKRLPLSFAFFKKRF